MVAAVGSIQNTPGTIPIWLDCDTGHDDAFAILLAATHPRSHFVGISTVFGNASLHNTTYNTRAILKAVNREDIPVYIGAARPFCREVAHAADIHGETGLDGTTCLPVPKIPANEDATAIEAMRTALLKTAAGSAWLVATGSLTNVALLFAVYPDLADHIAGVSIMGGAIGEGFAPPKPGQDDGDGDRIGNWTAWAEFNIYIDPESAKSVFDNPKLINKIRLTPLDLTHQFIATAEIQNTLLNGAKPRLSEPIKVRRLFVEILTFFAKTYAEVFGLRDGPPLHDPLAVAVVLAPELFEVRAAERFVVDVVTDGEHGSSEHIRSGPSQCGRTKVSLAAANRGGVVIPRTLDKNAVWRIIDAALGQVEQSNIDSREDR